MSAAVHPGGRPPGAILSVLVFALAGLPVRAQQAPVPVAVPALEEVVITASLRPEPALELAASVRVLDAQVLRESGQQHFEDVTALVPNLDWAGDTSRPRYFQVRGIGELEQYQGAPNPSVGLIVDDIDLSGLGTAATLFDIDHVEVLRGPQGTRYGANALAGLIYMQSAAPQRSFGGRVELGTGDYGSRSYGAVVTGPVESLDSAFRLAVQRYTSDGYYRNAYLGRRDTDANDELTARARWDFHPSDELRVGLTLLHVAIANGYDAWTLDGSRTTQTDHPSVDEQRSTGGSLRLDYRMPPATTLTAIGTLAETRVRYGYDSDFGNPLLWAPYGYDYTDLQRRERLTGSLELRLAGDPGRALGWLVGLYAFQLAEGLDESAPGRYDDPFDPTQSAQTLTLTHSHYRSRNVAAFGELDGKPGSRWAWSLGLRGERRGADYRDRTQDLDVPDVTHAFAPVDHLWGGHATLDYSLREHQRLYLQLARGYKAGGFNLGPGLPQDQVLFSPENDLNLEFGYKAEFTAQRLRLDADVFYTRRHSLQLKSGEQLVANDPTTFILYTVNANSGRNLGLESTLTWRASDALELSASLGLLDTAYHGLTLDGVVLEDRALPHAPDWQAALGATWHGRGGSFLHVDANGSGSYYFDVPALDPYKSSPYVLFNARAGFERERWAANLWVRNIGNRDYAVRGFYFGDVPPDFAPQQFRQLGPPRSFGAAVTLRF